MRAGGGESILVVHFGEFVASSYSITLLALMLLTLWPYEKGLSRENRRTVAS